MSLPSEQNWLVLNHLIADLNKKGYKLPNGINPEMGLNNIQATLLVIAEEEGEEYADYWLDLLKKVMQGEEVFEFANSKSRFLANTPPGLTTGRINLRVPLAEERVQEIAEWNGLIIEFDDDVTVQLHGDKEDLQAGLKEMGSFFLED